MNYPRLVEARRALRPNGYVTHAFHLLPPSRSAMVRASDIDQSFDAIGRHELAGHRIIALGHAAARCCARHGLQHAAVPHFSARGLTFADGATLLVTALNAVR